MDLFEGNFSTKSEIGGVWGGASRLFFFRNYHDARHQWGCVVGGDPNPTAHNTQDRAGFQSQSATAYATYIGNVAGIYGDSPNLSYKSGSQDSVFFYRSGTGTQDYATAFHGYTHNLTTGTTTWDEITEGSTIKNSYYLSSKPSFFGSIAWPPIGPDIVGYTIETPAKIFFDTGSWPDEAPTPTLTIPGGFTISGGKVE
jgi:hypothetical protein